MSTPRPIIGVPLCVSAPDNRVRGAAYDVDQCEVEAIKTAGAEIRIWTHDEEEIEQYVNDVDGVILLGNTYDIANAANGKEAALPEFAKKRLVFEAKVAREALKQGKPIFGICGGAQVLGSLMGMKMVKSVQEITGNPHSHGADGANRKGETARVVPGNTETFITNLLKSQDGHHISCRHREGFVVEEIEKFNKSLQESQVKISHTADLSALLKEGHPPPRAFYTGLLDLANKLSAQEKQQILPSVTELIKANNVNKHHYAQTVLKSLENCNQHTLNSIYKTGRLVELLETSSDGKIVEAFQVAGRDNQNAPKLACVATQYHPERNLLTGYPGKDDQFDKDDLLQESIYREFVKYAGEVKADREKGKRLNNEGILAAIDHNKFIQRVEETPAISVTTILPDVAEGQSHIAKITESQNKENIPPSPSVGVK